MKIALFHNLTFGGGERALYNLNKQLTMAGHAVDAFVPANADESCISLKDVVTRHRVFPIRRTFLGRASSALRRAALLSRSWLDDERAQKSIAETINAGSYDVVLSDQDHRTMSPFILRYLTGPVVYYCHQPCRSGETILAAELWLQEPDEGWRWWDERRSNYFRKAERQIDKENARFASYIVTNSDFTREAILRAYGVNGFVSYLGTDVDLFHPTNAPRGDFVLSVGSCHHIKGFDFIIRSLGRMDSKRRPKLVIVSNAWSKDWEAYLVSLAVRLKVDVTFKRCVSDFELVSLYNEAKLFVYAPYLEPFGLVVLEAMACGTPVFAVKEGGVRESVTHNETGILADRDEEVFAESMLDLLHDDQKRKRLTRNALDAVRGFWTWKHAAQRLEVHLARCASMSRGA
jgi:glycosyltransferase involved in cell wall biosynthesis